MASDGHRDLPYPVAALLRRSRNAKSPRDRHDAAYYAWEAAIRLAVAARPPDDASALARPSAGHWVRAMSGAAAPGAGAATSGAVMSDAATSDATVLSLFGRLTEAATDRRASPQTVEPRAVLDALVAYRNKVIGHGASTRPAAFYDEGAALLADGLAALWAAGAFLPADARLFHVESVEEDEQRRRRARLLELRAAGPEILDPAGTPDVPEAVVKGRLVLRTSTGWTDLFPWVLYRAESESTLFFNGAPRTPEYLDFASGDLVRGAALEEATPGVTEAIRSRLQAKAPTRAAPATPTPASDAAAGADAPADDPLIGQVLNGQYRIDRRISTDGFGALYEGHDARLDRRIAIKVMHRERAKTPEYVKRFTREARVLAQLTHPNIVAVHNAGHDAALDLHFLTTEYVAGRTLHDVLQERGPLPLEEACGYVLQICRGLQAAHERRIVHRDIKPGNLLLTSEGVLKIADFGLARVDWADAAHETIIGTPYYMPPEQFEGKVKDGRTDIYALGVTLYFLLTMKRPHAGDGPAQILQSMMTSEPMSVCEHRPELPPAIGPIVRRMIERDAEKRYASCNEVVAALLRAFPDLVAETRADAESRSCRACGQSRPDVPPGAPWTCGGCGYVNPGVAAARPSDPRRFGDFELLGKLGEGGMGVVYLARQQSLDRVVALKMLPTGMADDTVAAGRFRREMAALSRCDHSNVVKILASGSERGQLWYAMEYVEGADLAAVAGELKSSSGLDEAVSSASGKVRERHKEAFEHLPLLPRAPASLSPRRADKVRELAEAMRDAALGLEHLHAAGVIHRDVKPGNLMLTPERRVVVMDLGLAAMKDASKSLTRDKAAILGTLRYMPPEQLQRSLLDVDERSDVYALGATFYELLAGRPLFDGDEEAVLIRKVLYEEPPPARRVNPSLPEDVATIVGKCLAKDPRERYRSAQAVADDVQAYVDGRPIAARPPSFGYYARLAVRRNKPLAAAVAGLVVVLVAGLGVALWLRSVALDARGDAERALVSLRASNAAKDSALTQARVAGLSSASQLALEDRPMRALLLAREAVRQDVSSGPAVSALHAAVAASPERAVLQGHHGAIWSAALSTSGTLVVTASEDKTARIWEVTGKLRAVLRGHDAELRSAAFNRDDSLVVTASEDGTARIWGTDGTPRAVLRGHETSVVSAAFSPDGSRVVTASSDGTGRIWELGGTAVVVLRGHEKDLGGAVWSPDGSRVLTWSDDMTARIWSREGTALAVLRGHTGPIQCACFSPDGAMIATGSRDATARLWGLDGEPRGSLRGHTNWLWTVEFSRDGSKIVTASGDGTARVWDRFHNTVAELKGHGGPVNTASFSADGSKVVTGSLDRTTRIWSAASGESLCTLAGHGGRVWTARFFADDTRIVTASEDGTARIWSPDDVEVAVLGERGDVWRTAGFSPDGKRIVLTPWDGPPQIWDPSGRKHVALDGHEDRVTSAEFSHDGSQVVTASYDATARIWSADGRELRVLRGGDGPLLTARITPDGARVLTVATNGTVRSWDPAGGTSLLVFRADDPIQWARIGSDCGDVVTVSVADGGTVHWWEATGAVVTTLRGHTGDVLTAAIAEDAARAVTASRDRTACVWDRSGRRIATLRGHDDLVLTAEFSADASLVVTGSTDRTARIWDPSGQELLVLRGARMPVTLATFSPDGAFVLTASAGSPARVWLVHTADLLALADTRVTRDFTAEELDLYGDLLPDEAKDRARKALAK